MAEQDPAAVLALTPLLSFCSLTMYTQSTQEQTSDWVHTEMVACPASRLGWETLHRPRVQSSQAVAYKPSPFKAACPPTHKECVARACRLVMHECQLHQQQTV